MVPSSGHQTSCTSANCLDAYELCDNAVGNPYCSPAYNQPTGGTFTVVFCGNPTQYPDSTPDTPGTPDCATLPPSRMVPASSEPPICCDCYPGACTPQSCSGQTLAPACGPLSP